MKKLLVVLCIAAVAFAFTSCKKENKSSCKCSGSYTTSIGVAIPVGPVDVGDYTGTDCELYDWKWQSLVPSEYAQNFTHTCKSE